MVLRRVLAALLLLTLAGLPMAEARNHLSGRRGADAEAPQDDDAGERQMEIRASGLTPVFPRDAACPDIASPFASHTRYDGSRRRMDRFGGMHGGIDISLAEGTPLLAIAAGKVIASGTGGMLTGHYLWLQHAPDDTGLPFWVYAKYQHFRDVPDLPIGAVVTAGQVVAKSGKTGTVGKYYGSNGYPHLHLTTFVGGGKRYETRDSSVIVAGSRIVDPVAVYVRGLRNVEDLDRLPADQTNVTIPHVTDDGGIHPDGSRVVWPVACKSR